LIIGFVLAFLSMSFGFLSLARFGHGAHFAPPNDMTNNPAAVGQLIGNFFAQRHRPPEGTGPIASLML
jgi:hypothetical protein